MQRMENAEDEDDSRDYEPEDVGVPPTGIAQKMDGEVPRNPFGIV